jgi:hypothetical protein
MGKRAPREAESLRMPDPRSPVCLVPRATCIAYRVSRIASRGVHERRISPPSIGPLRVRQHPRDFGGFCVREPGESSHGENERGLLQMAGRRSQFVDGANGD